MKQLFILFFAIITQFASAQQVNTLKYLMKMKGLTKSSALNSLNGDTIIITQTENYIKQEKRASDPRVQGNIDYYGVTVFDLKDKIVTIEIDKAGYFFLEELDSFCKKWDVKSTGEKKMINGYNCEKYDAMKDERFQILYVSRKNSYKMSFWVTNEIDVLNKDLGFNTCMLSRNFFNIIGNGVVVKLEGENVFGKVSQFYEVNLIKTFNDPLVKTDYEKPWNNPKQRLAVADGSTSLYSFQTLEKDWERSERVGKRLKTLAGNTKVKRVSIPSWDAMYHF